MKAFMYNVFLQWKLDLRNKGVLLTYYIVPLIFYLFMGAIFTSVNPVSRDTLIQAMIVFNISMGAFLGTPVQVAELYKNDLKKAYRVGGIPISASGAITLISGLLHLIITSMIIYITAPLLFDAPTPISNMFLLSLITFIIASLMIGLLLGLFVKDFTKVAMYAQGIFLPSLMLSGIMFPASLLPSFLEYIGYIFPATWGYKSMVGLFDITNYWPLLIFVVVALIISIYKMERIKKID